MCDVCWPLPVVPSPKFQAQLEIEPPSGSVEPLPSKPQVRPVHPPVKLALGGVFAGGVPPWSPAESGASSRYP